MAADSIRAGAGAPVNLFISSERTRPIAVPGTWLSAQAKLVASASKQVDGRQVDTAEFEVSVAKRGRVSDTLSLKTADANDFLDTGRGKVPMGFRPLQEYQVDVQPNSTDASIQQELAKRINAREERYEFDETAGSFTRMSDRATFENGVLRVQVERERGLPEDGVKCHFGWL